MTSTDVRHKLDNWKFWTGVAYFVLVGVVVFMAIQWTRTNADIARTTRIVAERHAEVVANATAQYQQCVQSIPVLTHVNSFIVGVKGVDQALLKNTETSHVATPPDSPLFDAQIENIVRLRDAIKAANQVTFTIPSERECQALRQRLVQRN